MDESGFTHLAYYERLVLQIKQQVVTGILQPGDKLPSVRDMAQQVKLNPNTVAKAYKQLELDHLVVVRPGRGSFIAEPPTAPSQDQVAAIKQRFDTLTIEARIAGIPFSQLQEWLQINYQEKV